MPFPCLIEIAGIVKERNAALRDQMHLRTDEPCRLHRIGMPCVVHPGIVDRRVTLRDAVQRLDHGAGRYAVAVAFHLIGRKRRKFTKSSVGFQPADPEPVRRILPLEQDQMMDSGSVHGELIPVRLTVCGQPKLRLLPVQQIPNLQAVIADMVFNRQAERISGKRKLHIRARPDERRCIRIGTIDAPHKADPAVGKGNLFHVFHHCATSGRRPTVHAWPSALLCAIS